MAYQYTPEQAKQWIEILEDLKKWYQGKPTKNNWMDNCYLCWTADDMFKRNHKQDCPRCAWKVLEKIICTNFNKYACRDRINRDEDWSKLRIKMINKWIKQLKEIT